jgi:hypothetical protein
MNLNRTCQKNLELKMKLKTLAAGFTLAIITVTGVLMNLPDCIAGDAQYSPGSAQYTSLSVSPFKGPSTAPVVITVFSDFQ